MAQAPSEEGVRKSGIHWIGEDGRLRRPGGTFLDKYLRMIGYSVNPGDPEYQRPYTTNVLHCWTGRKGKRDRKPSQEELSNCMNWWLGEFKIIKPKVILLLGKPAAESFSSVCGESLSFAELLIRQRKVVTLGEITLRRFTVPHPTAPYGGKSEIYKQVIMDIGRFIKR